MAEIPPVYTWNGLCLHFSDKGRSSLYLERPLSEKCRHFSGQASTHCTQRMHSGEREISWRERAATPTRA